MVQYDIADIKKQSSLARENQSDVRACPYPLNVYCRVDKLQAVCTWLHGVAFYS